MTRAKTNAGLCFRGSPRQGGALMALMGLVGRARELMAMYPEGSVSFPGGNTHQARSATILATTANPIKYVEMQPVLGADAPKSNILACSTGYLRHYCQLHVGTGADDPCALRCSHDMAFFVH